MEYQYKVKNTRVPSWPTMLMLLTNDILSQHRSQMGDDHENRNNYRSPIVVEINT